MVMTYFREEQNERTCGNWCPSEYPHIRFPDLLHEIRWNIVLGSTLLKCPVELVSFSVSSLIYIKLSSRFLFFFKADHRKGKWLVVIGRKYRFLFVPQQSAWDLATSLLRFQHHTQLDTHTHTHTHNKTHTHTRARARAQLDTHTPGRTPPNYWSAHHRGRYLHRNKKERQTLMPPSRFKPAIPAMKRLKTCALDRPAIGTGCFFYWAL